MREGPFNETALRQLEQESQGALAERSVNEKRDQCGK
jgi:hypothetical protein